MIFVPPSNTGQEHAAVSYPAGSGFFFHRRHSAGPGGSLLNTQEVRFVDGTVHVLRRYTGPVSGSGTPWRITKRLDAYDNLTLYHYDNKGRLARIEYPNGVDELYNYTPSWIGTAKWPSSGAGVRYSGVEVTFVDRLTQAALPDRAMRYVFLKRGSVDHGTVLPQLPQGQAQPATAPFDGDLLYRIYFPASHILDDLVNPQDNVLYDLATDQERHRVIEYSYVPGTALLASVGVRHSDGITGPESPVSVYLEYEYGMVGGRARVTKETYALEGIHYDYLYVCDTGASDQYGQNPITLTQRTSSLGAVLTWTFDAEGRILSETHSPRTGVAYEDRSLDSDYDAAAHGAGQIASYEILYEYSGRCSCGGKPTAVVMPGGARTEYDYDPVTGLMTEMREPDPRDGVGFAVTQFNWEEAVQGDTYGRYRLASTTYPDGATWTYSYQSTPRVDPSHGTKDEVVTTTSPVVTGSVATSGALVNVESYEASAPVLDAQGGWQSKAVGQLKQVVDENGLTTNFEYDGRGWLERVTTNPGGGANELVDEYVFSASGRLQQARLRVGSAQELVTNFTIDGLGNPRRASRTVGGVLHEEEYYYDRWGNLSVARLANKTSAGAAPDDFHPTSPRAETARSWIRDEWHYNRGFLLCHFRDRRPLDRSDLGDVADAIGARMIRSDYSWTPDGWLHEVVGPSGSLTRFSYDGFGVPFRTAVVNPSGGELVVGKRFVDAALQTIAVVDGNGAETRLVRNLVSGLVTSVREPATSSTPNGYPWGSIERAETSLSYDVMGRATSATTSEVAGAALVTRVATYDEVGRLWKTEAFEGANTSPSQTFQGRWVGSRLVRRDLPGGRFVTRTYDALGRLATSEDCRPGNPNTVEAIYFDKSPFPSRVTQKQWDEGATTPAYVEHPVNYVRDELGRVVTMQVARASGGAGSLDHSFSYYTTGQTESYTDPAGKIERFLPDALGRLRERFLPGAQPIWNGSKYLDWTGVSSRSEKLLTDGQGHTTRTIYDFAGRPEVVMEPGSTTVPTSSSPHQAHARMFAYDAASRLTDVYASDDVHIHMSHDAVGRLLQRQRVFSQVNSLVSNLWGRDSLRRNALGQVVELRSRTGLGPGGVGDEYIHETFSRDALGRTLLEEFNYGGGIANRTSVSSLFNGGDPFRTELHLTNTVGAGSNDLYMRYVPDAIGRVASIDWKTDATPGAAWIDLVDYAHEGSAIRTRKTTQALGVAQGTTPFDFTTTYDYDDYGRMSRIEHSFDPQNAYYDFFYDDASNLVKEGYLKQGGGVGDRFAYDEHHRLLDAWMGSDQPHFDTGTGSFVKQLTYNLDAANNRDSVVEDSVTTDYTIESDSNRYAQIGAITLAHDSRGNTHFDGVCYFVFDALNRLTEVYKLVPQDVSSGTTSASSLESSETTFAVNDLTALEAARNQILLRLAPQAAALLHLPNDSGVRADSKEDLSPSVATATTTAESGEQTQDEVVLEMVAFYLYDPINRRVTRWVRDDATYYYAYDGWQEVQRYAPDAQVIWVQSARGEEFDELLAYRTSAPSAVSTNRYIAEGGAHCPMGVLEEAGLKLESQEYGPYGLVEFFDASGGRHTSSQVANMYGWRMMVPDAETGLYYCRNRYYDARLGRFVSLDPLGVAGDAVTWLNAYNYGGGRPLTESDPLGLQTQETFREWAKAGGMKPGETKFFAEPRKSSWSGTEYNGLRMSEDGWVFPVNSEGRSIFFPSYKDHMDNPVWWETGKKLGHALDGASFGIRGLWGSDRELPYEDAGDYVVNIASGSAIPIGVAVNALAKLRFLKRALDSASQAYRGTTKMGHSLSKHMRRNPCWPQLKGNPKTWHAQARKVWDEIVNAPGRFKTVKDPKTGLTWIEKRLSDGRGIRLNADGTFKGFID